MNQRTKLLSICRAAAGILLALLPMLDGQLSTAEAQGTAFTYQGRLNDGGTAANGTYDLAFALYGTNSGGVALASPVTNSATVVSNGLFTTTIDFGSGIFRGSNYWLGISVRTNGVGSFVDLSPRQPITPTPYAITAENLAGVAENNDVNGTGATVSGGVGNWVSANYATVGGGTINSSTAPGATVGGGNDNLSGGVNATVAGGFDNTSVGYSSAIGGGVGNVSAGQGSFVGGGYSNIASNNDDTVGGGFYNSALGNNAVVAGGALNRAQADGAAIGGGENNTNLAGNGVIGGGSFNMIQASASASVIGGGSRNSVTSNVGTVAGGQMNTAGSYGFVGGGVSNSAAGNGATIPGGTANHSGGKNSFAAGSSAHADADYSFVWSDGSSPLAFSATTTNQFSALASGGVRFVTGGAGMTLDGQPVATANALSNVAVVVVSNNFGVAGNLSLAGNSTNSGTLWNNGSVSGGIYSNVTFGSQVSGLSTNLGIGEFWACDYGYNSTNSPDSNAVAMDRIINVVSNAGGGIIRLGSRFARGEQVIEDSGEHMFPPLGGLVEQRARFKLKGDNTIVIKSTLTSTTHGVFWGQFDAEDFGVWGVGTNSAWAYPYTNYVGIYEIGFNNPQLKNVTVRGFGQGFAMEELGSVNGSLWEQCDASQCMIGYAVGEACDSMQMIGSSARACLIGMDQACLVPIPNNVPTFAGLAYTGTNVGSSRAVLISGGLWAYNNIMFTLGKAQNWKIQNMHTEFITGCLLQIGHTNSIYPLMNETSDTSLILDTDQWVGGGPIIPTNIVLNASAASLTIRNCAFNNAVVGMYGSLSYFDTDGSVLGATNWISTAGSIYDMEYKPLIYHSGISPGQTFFTDEYEENYLPGSVIYRTDAHLSPFDGNVTVWTAGVVDGSFNTKGDQNRLSYIHEGTAGGLLSLANASEQITGGNFFNAGINAVASEVVTNSIQINSNSVTPTPARYAGKLWVSNLDLYWVTKFKTNLVVLGE